MKLTSLEGRLAALSVLVTSAVAGLTAILVQTTGQVWVSAAAGAVAGGILALGLARRWTQPLSSRMRALSTAVSGLAEGDFGISVTPGGGDELEQLIASFNAVGDVLRQERQNLHQRELLLDTVIQATPVAMVLIDARNRVIYANMAARQQLNEGRRLEGVAWDEVISRQHPDASSALAHAHDGLFSVEDDRGERQVFMLSQKDFRLNNRSHRLVLMQQMTRELNRQEVATWKKVIRVISHELNNSVAPISSMVHSSRKLAERGDLQKLDRALSSIAERTRHLAGFIDRYARFARLPEPNVESVEWDDYFRGLTEGGNYQVACPLPERAGVFDRTQLEQVIINLLKNAVEAGSEPRDVTLSCRDAGNGFWVEVADRGQGMSPATLSQALVPFYSTKREGSGIGLSLCREIIEAHEGHLSIRNRRKGGVRVRLFLPNRRPA